MKNNRATISDVAAKANVSKSTVSNYLNGRFVTMSHETKERIEEAIQQLSYTPSLSARRLAAKEKCRAICMVIPFNISHAFDTLYYPTVMSTIGEIAEKMNYNVLIFARNRPGIEKDMEYLKGMASTMVDGFIIYDLQQNDFYFKEFEKANIPYVCVGKIYGYDDYHYVASDHEQAITDAVEYLLKLGHRKISMILENSVSAPEQSKIAGYKKAFQRCGIPVSQNAFYDIDPHSINTDQMCYEKCREILAQKDHPTAIICSIVFMHTILRVAEENHLSVPEDLSLIATEYSDRYQFSYINFTRIRTIASEVSVIAFKKLIRSIYNKNDVFQSQMNKLSLIVGDTTAPVKDTRSILP